MKGCLWQKFLSLKSSAHHTEGSVEYRAEYTRLSFGLVSFHRQDIPAYRIRPHRHCIVQRSALHRLKLTVFHLSCTLYRPQTSSPVTGNLTSLRPCSDRVSLLSRWRILIIGLTNDHGQLYLPDQTNMLKVHLFQNP